MEKKACPKCGNNHIQSLPMVYSSGTSTSETSGSFVAASVGNNFNATPTFGTTEQKTKSMSLLAQQYAPPRTDILDEYLKSRARWRNLFIASIFAFFIPYDIIKVIAFLFAMLAILAYTLKLLEASAVKDEDNKNNNLYREWKQTYLCFTCGVTFIPNSVKKIFPY